jgi:hypothetical protein
MLIWLAAMLSPVPAETIVVCAPMSLPGKENTLNPNAPPDKQVQDTIKVCAQITVPDKPWTGPITDYHHDPRAFA